MFKVVSGYLKRRWREWKRRTRTNVYRRVIYDAIVCNVDMYLDGRRGVVEFAKSHRNLKRVLREQDEHEVMHRHLAWTGYERRERRKQK